MNYITLSNEFIRGFVNHFVWFSGGKNWIN